MTAVLVAATGLQLFCSIGFAQQDATGELEKKLAEICRENNVPSLTAAAFRGNEAIVTACSGIRKLGADDAVELTDRHPLGSNTKSMTATLAAILVEEGLITWETTVGEVWKAAGEKHLHPSLRDVTLDELLSHQSGLRSDISGRDWGSFFKEKNKPRAERQRMLKLIMKRKPKHKRGEFHYSNLGYVVAAAMLEKRTDEDYETMMHERIFKPLKIESAEFRTMATAKKLKEPLVWGHDDDGQPVNPRVAGAENPCVYAPCGTVHITMADYVKYAQWHLRGQPEPLLSKQETFNHLHTAMVDRADGGGKYAAGWIVIDMGIGDALNHGGSNTNSYALIWVLPHADFGAIVCSNSGPKSGFPACNAAIVELLTQYAK